jgi:hypothetical protein
VSTTFTIRDDSVPEGNYEAVFVGYEQRTHEEYGEGYRWEWEITNGPQKGKAVYRTTPLKPTTRNACGAVLAALGAQSQGDGVQVNPDAYVGKAYLIIVKKSPSGKGTRVHELILKEGEPPF